MTYLTRPVFLFRLNRSTSPKVDYEFDHLEHSLGFGADTSQASQVYTRRVHKFSLDLITRDEIDQFQDFIDELQGRRRGFWIPLPEFGLTVTSGVNSTQVDVKSHGLTEHISGHATNHFLVKKADGTYTASEAVGSADNLNGTERITFGTSLGSTPTTAWQFWRMAYVRLASDDSNATTLGEGREIRPLTVVEVPPEYGAIETGTEPVYLYRFYASNPDGTTTNWRYTSFDVDVVSNGNTFSAFNLNHGSLSRFSGSKADALQISSVITPASPFALYVPFPYAMPLWVELKKAQLSTPDTTETLFTGRLDQSPEVDGTKMVMKFTSWLDSLDFTFPRVLIGPRCQWKLYDSSTCKVSKATYLKTASITSQSGTKIVVTDASLAGSKADYYSRGWIEVNVSGVHQVRTIVLSEAASSNSVTLHLNRRLVAVPNATSIKIYPGCDKTYETCDSKFSNLPNHVSFRNVPRENLSIKAVEINSDSGAKK